MTLFSSYADRASAAAQLTAPESAHVLVKRLPVTMRPTVNQQLHGWESLFPHERRRLLGFMDGVNSFTPDAWKSLTQPLVELEHKMGVDSWEFSEQEDTMENASHLARSAYYIEWREKVQSIFKGIEAAAEKVAPPAPKLPRLLVLVLPESLPVPPPEQWKPWDVRARVYRVADGVRGLDARLLQGHGSTPGLAAALASHAGAEGSDLWLLDAAAQLPLLDAAQAEQLRYGRLLSFRDRFLEEVNKMPKNLAVSDKTLAEVRRQNWERWCPEEMKAQPRLRNFLVDLLLSGNGALIFPSAFVEWASSEALRRARPRALVARFGMRTKPKLFTGIAIFENQQRISTLPDVDDPEGSAVDALELARYVWLAAVRYPEQEQTVCLCIAERHNAVYLIAPEGVGPAWSADKPVRMEEIGNWVIQFMKV